MAERKINLDMHGWVDVYDTIEHCWFEAQIVDTDYKNPDLQRVKIHYKSYSPEYDEWLEINSLRLEPLHTHTPRPKYWVDRIDFDTATKLRVLDTHNVWLTGIILDQTPTQVHIHYHGWDAKWDEWIDKDSYRLAPYNNYGRDAKLDQ